MTPQVLLQFQLRHHDQVVATVIVICSRKCSALGSVDACGLESPCCEKYSRSGCVCHHRANATLCSSGALVRKETYSPWSFCACLRILEVFSSFIGFSHSKAPHFLAIVQRHRVVSVYYEEVFPWNFYNGALELFVEFFHNDRRHTLRSVHAHGSA